MKNFKELLETVAVVKAHDNMITQACDELLAMYDETNMGKDHPRAAFIDRIKEASSCISWEPSEA